MLNVLIADDHFSVRVGVEVIVRDAIGDCTVDFASNGNEVLIKVREKKFDLAILDLNMPQHEGLPLINELLLIQEQIGILILTASDEDYFAARCLKAGAHAFIQKGVPEQELKKAIATVAAGRHYISPEQKDLFANRFIKAKDFVNPFDSLSERELEVTKLMLKGLGVLEIANALDITPSTASTFKGRIFKKLEVKNVIELHEIGKRYGLMH